MDSIAPEDHRFAFARRGATLAVAGLCLTLIATMSWGDVLVSRHRQDEARQLPGNTSIAAVAQFEASGRMDPPLALVATAYDALRNSPVAGEALTTLALHARAQGKQAAAARLLDLSGRMGWHDETGRRQLFNLAVSRGDADNALYHADALLRQGRAREELFASLNAAMGDPRLRRAIAPYVIRAEGWPQDWLALHGAKLPDAALTDLLSTRARALKGLDRATAAPILVGLVGAGRLAMAASVWQLVTDGGGRSAGPLAWSSVDDRQLTPFDWTLPGGLAINDAGALIAPENGESVVAKRLLALPPGRYRLSFTGTPPAGWRWSFGCGAGGGVPVEPLRASVVVSVAQGCPVQHLSFSPSTLNAAGVSPLGAPTLERLP